MQSTKNKIQIFGAKQSMQRCPSFGIQKNVLLVCVCEGNLISFLSFLYQHKEMREKRFLFFDQNKSRSWWKIAHTTTLLTKCDNCNHHGISFSPSISVYSYREAKKKTKHRTNNFRIANIKMMIVECVAATQ